MLRSSQGIACGRRREGLRNLVALLVEEHDVFLLHEGGEKAGDTNNLRYDTVGMVARVQSGVGSPR